jgi:outer membrane protein, heavy metal efflux system
LSSGSALSRFRILVELSMKRHTFHAAAVSSARVISAVLLAAGGQAGCQSHERRPLDVAETRDAWLSRSASDESVRVFAERLASANPGASAFDPADGLTLAEAEVVALVFNPDLRQARLEAGVWAAGAEFAGLWDDPVLGVDIERIVRGAGGANPWVAGGTVGITIPLSGRLEAAKSRADAQARAELDRVAAREWATRSSLRELWVEWSAASMRLQIGRDVVARLQDIVHLAGLQEQAGSMSRLDARLFRVELARREADVLEYDGRLQELELQVRSMLGLSPRAQVTLMPVVSFATRELQGEAPRDAALLAAMESSSPELAAVRSQYEVAEQSLREEVRKQYPDLVIGPGYGRDQGDDRVLLGLQVPLPLWNRNRQGVAEAKAEREAARGRFEGTYQHLATRLAIAMVRFESGKAQRAAVESTVVPLADEQEADARRVASLGRVDPLLLLESLKTQHDARLRLIDTRASESIGAVRVAELLGPLGPSDASTPSLNREPTAPAN